MLMPNKPTPLKAIKLFCATCADGPREAAICKTVDCPLWDFRNGKNPHKKGNPLGNPSSLEKARQSKVISVIKTEIE